MRLALIGILLGGCTLYENGGGGGGGDDDVIPPNGGPVGRFFSIDRTKTAPNQCFFKEEDMTHSVSVESGSSVFVDGIQPAGVVVRTQPAVKANGDPPNVVFAMFESWSGVEGGSASPMVQYDIWVSGNTIIGDARTAFSNSTPIGPPSCSYVWTLSGF
jgi:hypothetical protein